MTRRLAGVAATEVRLLWRYHVLTAVVVSTAIWVGILFAVPESAARVLVPPILFLDVTALGFFFVPVMSMVERSEGSLARMLLSRLSPGEHALVRVGLTTLLALAAGAAVVAVAPVDSPAAVLLGVLLTSLLAALVARTSSLDLETVTSFMARVPVVAIPLLLPAIVVLARISEAPALYLSPMSSGVALLSGRFSLAGVAWMLGWIAMLGFLARRGPRAAIAAPSRPVGTLRWPAGTISSLLRADRLSLVRDRLSVMIFVGIPLVAVALRAFGHYGPSWIAARHGIDVVPHLPFVWAFLLVIHTPTLLGSLAGLLFLEDRDAGLVPALAVTRASLRTLLAYRLGALAFATISMTALGFAVASATHAGGPMALAVTALSTGPLAAVTALSMASVASNRAQGIAAMKVITLPLYLPAGLWFVEAPWRHVLDWIPSTWSVRAMWSGSAGEAALHAGAGMALSVSFVIALARRFERQRVV